MATPPKADTNAKPEAPAKPVATAGPSPRAADPNGTASAADKEYFRRKNHGGTGA